MLIDAFVSSSLPRLPTAVASVGDPAATRTVYTTVIILVVLGFVLAAVAVWVLRRTRPEPELLAPLETMDTRGWRKLDPAARRRALDESRPPGALPLRREASEPAVDESFSTVAPVASFDDLSDHHDDVVLSPSQSESLGESVVVVADDRPDDDDREVDVHVDEEVGAHDESVALTETGESQRIAVAEDDQVGPVAVSDEDTDEIERKAEKIAGDASVERSIDPLLTSKRSSSDRTS